MSPQLEEANRRIEVCIQKGLRALHLTALELDAMPEKLLEATHLQTLGLTDNLLKELSPDIA